MNSPVCIGMLASSHGLSSSSFSPPQHESFLKLEPRLSWYMSPPCASGHQAVPWCRPLQQESMPPCRHRCSLSSLLLSPPPPSTPTCDVSGGRSVAPQPPATSMWLHRQGSLVSVCPCRTFHRSS